MHRNSSLVSYLLTFLFLLLTPHYLLANSSADEANVKRMLGLLDYIATDYSEAVRDGKVVSEAEFKEMSDFAATVQAKLPELQTLNKSALQNLQKDIQSLKFEIAKKGDISSVRQYIKNAKTVLYTNYKLDLYPKFALDLSNAASLYQNNCASCHGASAHGDGPLSVKMEPPPRDFHEAGVLDHSSPFKFFNLMNIGVSETAMRSYESDMTLEQRWNLAFYLSAARQFEKTNDLLSDPENKDLLARFAKDESINLELLATKTDGELLSWAQEKGYAKDEKSSSLSLYYLRAMAPYRNAETAVVASVAKGENQNAENVLAIDATLAEIAQAKSNFSKKMFIEAEGKLIDAYLNQFEKTEVSLTLLDKTLVQRVEGLFIEARKHARAKDEVQFQSAISELEKTLNVVKTLFSKPEQEKSEISVWSGEFFSSFIIILREGFEAFLIIAAILALLRNIDARHLNKWIHAGWIMAVIAGFLTFIVTNYLIEISGAAKEVVEGISTAVAAVVLFYVSFWLLSNSEKKSWEKLIRNSATDSVNNGKVSMLFFLAFIAVYREAAETVLFYQALVNSASFLFSGIVMGLIVGTLVLAVICFLFYYYGLKLPMKKFFLATSTIMIVLSIILSGKAINEIIEAGYLKGTVVGSLPRVELIGFYPVWESLLVQGILVAFALTYYIVIVSRAKTAAN